MTLARFRRWLRSDVGDVVRIVSVASPARSAPAIGLTEGLQGWGRRIFTARAVVLISRQLALALGIAIVLELLGALTGASGRAVWLALPGGLAMLGVLAGLRHRPQPQDTALLLDSQLALAERLTTALQLDSGGAAVSPLGTVLRSEADAAIGASLVDARARARFSRNELLAILASAAVLAALLVLPGDSHARQARPIGGHPGAQSAGAHTGGRGGRGASGLRHGPARQGTATTQTPRLGQGTAIQPQARTQAAPQTKTGGARPAARAKPGAREPTNRQGTQSTAQHGKGAANLHGPQTDRGTAQAGTGADAKPSGQPAGLGAALSGARQHGGASSGGAAAHRGRTGSASEAAKPSSPSPSSRRPGLVRHAASPAAGHLPSGHSSSGHPSQGASPSQHSSHGAAQRGAAGSPAAKTGAGAARGATPRSQSGSPTAARGGTATLPIQAGWTASRGQRGSTAPAGADGGGGGGRGRAQGVSSAAASTTASFPFIPLLTDEVPASGLDLLLGYFGASSGLSAWR